VCILQPAQHLAMRIAAAAAEVAAAEFAALDVRAPAGPVVPEPGAAARPSLMDYALAVSGEPALCSQKRLSSSSCRAR
jgi:hypothetical protein